MISICMAKKTREFLQIHIRPQSVMLLLCAARAHCPFLHLQVARSLYSTMHSILPMPASLPPCKLTSPQSSPLPVSHRAVNAVSLTSDTGRNAVDWLSGGVVPCTRTSSSLAVQWFIVLRIHVHCCSRWACFYRLVPWPSPSPGPAGVPLHSNTRGGRPMNSSRNRSPSPR